MSVRMRGPVLGATACVVGGDPPGGNARPCETLHIGCIEAWRINEATGTLAAGVLGRVSLTLTPWEGRSPAQSWHVAGAGGVADDHARGFFGGVGVATLPATSPAHEAPLLSRVGDGLTIAIRRWHVGADFTVARTPPAFVPFGQMVYAHADVRTIDGTGPNPPAVVSQPTLGPVGAGGQRPVTPGPLHRQQRSDWDGSAGGLPGERWPIPGTTAPGCPAAWPPANTQTEPRPSLTIITMLMIAPDAMTISVMQREGAEGTGPLRVACLSTRADGRLTHEDGEEPAPSGPPAPNILTDPGQFLVDEGPGATPPPPPTPTGGTGVGSAGNATVNATLYVQSVPSSGIMLGEPTIFATAPLRVLRIGGGPSIAHPGEQTVDTIHQAAVWGRALTIEEAAFLTAQGSHLDRLFASLTTPGSLCGGGEPPCNEEAGPDTMHPLLTSAGGNALRYATIVRVHVASEATEDGSGEVGSASVLRAGRSVHDARARRYRLSWSGQGEDDGADVELVRKALARTKGGAIGTRWRHPVDDAPGDVCSAPRWRIVEAEGVERGRGGVTGAMSVVLEEAMER